MMHWWEHAQVHIRMRNATVGKLREKLIIGIVTHDFEYRKQIQVESVMLADIRGGWK